MAQFDDILKEIEKSIDRFNRRIPATQKDVLAAIEEDLRGLDLESGKIKATVKNLSLIARIKNRLTKIILTSDYKGDVKQFAESFNQITKLQNEYWKGADQKFKPKALLREIKNITVEDTVRKLMESGINANLVDPVSDILRTATTGGGSYRALTDQLRESLTDTDTPGLLSKYAKTTTVDSLNTYSAQYSQVVSSDLGFQWYKYSNSDIETTRPFCDAMTDQPYFHVSEIPALLRAEGLTYVNKEGQRVSVPIYQRTGLPHGMKAGTDASNFLINRGGWNCGHQCRPVSEGLVPADIVERVKSSPGYLRWKSSVVPKNKEPEMAGKDVEQLRQNVQEAEQQKKDSFDFYRDPSSGAITKERQELHNKIFSDYMEGGSSNEGTAYLLGGAPASGKSVLTRSGVIPLPKNILVMDSDKIKAMIPDYDQMVKDNNANAANFVHEESSFLGKEIVARSLAKGYDLALDGVGDGSYASLTAKIQKFKDAGKRTRADYVTCDTELTLDRARARAAQTGREVPESYILEMNKEISKLVPRLAKNNVFDELYLWDNNDTKGARLIFSQVNGKMVIKDQVLYDRFLKKQNDGR